jgi:hypothetical protein
VRADKPKLYEGGVVQVRVENEHNARMKIDIENVRDPNARVSNGLNLYDDFLHCQFTDLSYSSLPTFIADFYQVCFQ